MAEILLSTALLVALTLVLTLSVITARRIMQPRLPVEVTINDKTLLQAITGDKLLAVLKAHDVHIPSGCAGAGTCGLCRVRIGAGGGVPLPTETARLSSADIHDGFRLACQVVVREPLSVRLPDDMLSAQKMTCKVVSSKMMAPLIKEIILSVPDDIVFEPTAGSFVQIEAPAYALAFHEIDIAPDFAPVWDRLGWRALRINNTEPTSRAYSLANTPSDAGCVVLNIRLAVPPPGAGSDIPPGVVSSYLFGLKPDDEVQLSGPFGDFGLQDSETEIVLIGGGVGMAPLRAMVHAQLARKEKPRRMSFWYGARSLTDAFYIHEFEALDAKHPEFTFTLALSEPGTDDAGRAQTGFIHEVVYQQYLKDHPNPEACEYYLCGPPLMIHSVKTMLENLGVEDDAIFFDDFGS